MQGLHENQKKILDFLLERSDGVTLEEIAEHLEVTKTAAKEHLLKLDHHGYIQFTDVKGNVGRPRRLYSLSPAGQEVFPRQYSWLSNVLLELLAQDFGPKVVSKIMRDLGKKVAASMRERFEGKPRPEMLAEVSKALNELGYRSYLKQSDVRKGAVIEANNCVYHSVAKAHPELCQFDIQFLESSTGLKVKMESCIARGGSICRFCLTK